MCDFVCGTILNTKLSLHLSVIHYQMTSDEHSGCGSEKCII